MYTYTNIYTCIYRFMPKWISTHTRLSRNSCWSRKDSVHVHCNTLLYTATCCNTLQRVAVYCSVLQCIAVYCSVLQGVAGCCRVLQCVVCWSREHSNSIWLESHERITSRYERVTSHIRIHRVIAHATHQHTPPALQPTATHCNPLQHTATHRNTPQHTATYCTTPQHTATLRNVVSLLPPLESLLLPVYHERWRSEVKLFRLSECLGPKHWSPLLAFFCGAKINTQHLGGWVGMRWLRWVGSFKS